VANRSRFKQLVHYVCSQCAADPTKLGATQLNKALWLSDLRSYYQLGEPITSARYLKRQYGPAPSSIVPVLRELQQEGALTVKTVDHFGKPKKEFVVKKKLSGNFLADNEKRIVDEAIKYVTERHTASSISAFSHDHIWQAAEDGEEIPHFTVFANPGEVTDEELEWANLKLEGSL
jgi:Protein of unknown function (DUF4065)